VRGGVGGTFTGDGARRRSRAEEGDEGSLERERRGGVGIVMALVGGGDCIATEYEGSALRRFSQ